MVRLREPLERGALPTLVKQGNSLRWEFHTWDSTRAASMPEKTTLAPLLSGAGVCSLAGPTLARLPSATKGVNSDHGQQREPATPRRHENEQNLPFDVLNTSPRQLEDASDLMLVPPRKRMRQHTNNGAPAAAGRSGALHSHAGDSNAPTNNGNHRGEAPGQPGRKFNSPGGEDGGNGTEGNGNGGGNDEGSDYDSDDMENDAANKVDTQCTWCDDGGFLLECDGRCRRSFHVGIQRADDGDDQPATFVPLKSECNILGVAPDLAEALVTSSVPFLCPCCLAKEQQCFACGEFGHEGTEVKRCLVASCGRFYHSTCMKEAKKSLGDTARGLKEMCPVHWCSKCKKQDMIDDLGEIVQCRRCPRAYHRRCIPPRIHSLDRVWFADYDRDGVLLEGCQVETSLLYCLDHKMDESGVAEQRPLFSAERLDDWTKHYAKEFPHLVSSKVILSRTPPTTLDEAREDESMMEVVEEMTGAEAPQMAPQATSTHNRAFSTSSVRKSSQICARNHARYLLHFAKKDVGKEELKREMRQPIPYNRRLKKSVDEVGHKCSFSRSSLLFLNGGGFLFSLQGVLANLEDTTRYAYDQYTRRNVSETTLTTLLSRGATQEIARKHDDLMLIMAPYIFSGRYSSYGRHFTHPTLLQQVTNRLVPLLRNGDCLVDFSCGKNEFIPMVKEAARQDGIVVTGRAYDIIVAKDLADFVLKSWFDVLPREGEKLFQS